MMNKAQVLFLMISISAITLIGREVIDKYAFPKVSHAQGPPFAKQPRWDYCSIVGNGYSRRGIASRDYVVTIHFYHPSGIRTETVELEEIKEGPTGEAQVFAKAIARLGDEGWEMVQDQTREGKSSLIYFKKPK
jgi:hypothetical protein